jgi:hypothetical protein
MEINLNRYEFEEKIFKMLQETTEKMMIDN